MKLLIIGSDPDVKTEVAKKLEAEGYEVGTAPFEGAACAKLADAPWNAYLLAINGNRGNDIPSLDDIERRHIELVLGETKFNLSHAARVLGIDRTTLYNKLRKYGISRNHAMEAGVSA